MNTQSVWRGTAPSPGFGMLNGDLGTEVLIIGGGITGLTLAMLLARQGRQVVLIEADEIGSGTTGHSTGNLYETLSGGLHTIRSGWGEQVVRQVVAERRAAIEFIEEQSRAATGVGFRRCPLVLYAMSPSQQGFVDGEIDTLLRAGAQQERRSSIDAPLPPAAGPVLVLPNQAQIQPQAYATHLARQAAAAGASLHEHTRALQIDARAKIVETATGAITAREIVMATHTPKGIRFVHAEMPVHREYAVALPFGAGMSDPGPGIFWALGDEGLSIRTYDADGQRFVICVGREHPPGAHNAKAALMAVEAAAARHFGAVQPAFRWSAQNYHGADGLPYIGRDSTGCFIATGFATDGLTWGTVAARLIAEELSGSSPAFASLCKPSRLSLIKGAKSILEEVAVTAKSLVKDYLTHRQEEKLSSLAPGDSAIIDSDGGSCAAWRSPQGELFAVSAVCTHMGCKVHWNSVETSWDCPCHGSRFRPDGTVIEGPALRPLAVRHPRSLKSG
ncbi:FAD-dependent oxidoreductase [Ramlibacter sp. AW1]|uniref:FAD-dependent oxidoreductase n=1 Tax=Ramlibacter aurantiacus TaxID=2801330 RepID=A0A937D199_9BURK|nr:FAD-dependent oxidoreductase [Ramlibacter aurantiacus]MBL0420304.1 FAD-dependent oxidoreductase [Ramlibacter aurantiacus]